MKRILVLASGRGSNFKSIVEATRLGVLRAEIVALGVSKRGVAALGIAESNSIPTLVEPSEVNILEYFNEKRIDAIVLAGYMKILSENFIERIRGENLLSRVLNVHPSLLPAFPGKDSYRQAFEAGVRETGITIHLVEKEVDSGPILDQKSFRIDRLSSTEEVEARGLAIEHDLYPRTIDWFIHGEYRVGSRLGRTYVEKA
jgi:phosphoribosylglycinamide formyltransferase-1